MGVPKGSPKHGGRQKGSLNKATVALQQAVASRLRRPRTNSLEKMRQLAGIIEGLASGWLKGNTLDEELPRMANLKTLSDLSRLPLSIEQIRAERRQRHIRADSDHVEA